MLNYFYSLNFPSVMIQRQVMAAPMVLYLSNLTKPSHVYNRFIAKRGLACLCKNWEGRFYSGSSSPVSRQRSKVSLVSKQSGSGEYAPFTSARQVVRSVGM